MSKYHGVNRPSSGIQSLFLTVAAPHRLLTSQTVMMALKLLGYRAACLLKGDLENQELSGTVRISMKRYGFFLALLFAAIFSWQTGRVETKGMQESSSIGSADSCIACHTNYQTLQALASPDTEPPMEGCGGAAPHIDPCDRVFLGGPGYELSRASAHGRLSCTACHGGVDGNHGQKSSPTRGISSSTLHRMPRSRVRRLP
jgi:hypothetical protein